MILLLFILLPAVASETKIVKVGAFENYPVLFHAENGEATGMYVDLLSAIGQKENIRFEYVFGTWQEGLDRIKAGDVDLLTSVAYSEERARFMDYCQIPLLTVWGELYTVKLSNINGMLDLEGKKVGVLKGDINAENFSALSDKFGIHCTLVEFSSYENVFRGVADGKVDAGVTGVTFGTPRLKKYGLRSTGIVFNPLDIFFTTGKGRNYELRVLLDSYLSNWKRQPISVYSQSKQRWLYGSVGSAPFISVLLIKIVVFLVFIFMASVMFIIILKMQISNGTRKIRESEITIRCYIDNAPDGVFVTDENGKLLEANRAAEIITGYTRKELLKMTVADLLPPESAEMGSAHFRRLKETGTSNGEMPFRHKSGKPRWWSVDAVMISPTRYLGCTKDITGRKTDEERIKALLAEKELLLREVHHRIKNNMNTIKGLLTMQIEAERNPETKASLRDAESRVQSIILLYDRLYCTENYREISVRQYIQPLTAEIVHGFPGSDAVTIQTDIEDFILNVQYLIPLGIIINEILTNMMKYAFAGRECGLISVTARHKAETILVVLEDNGVGLPESITFEESTGFGMNLVKMLVDQIGGSITIERGNGTKFILEFSV